MKKAFSVLFPIILFTMSFRLVWAQEDPVEKVIPMIGPHGGKIIGSGNYFLEIIWEADGVTKIYLLDSDFRNETVQNSEVGIFISSGNVESEMSCQIAGGDFFECKQGGKRIKKGELAISSKRNGLQGEEIKVKVPFEKAKVEKSLIPAKKK